MGAWSGHMAKSLHRTCAPLGAPQTSVMSCRYEHQNSEVDYEAQCIRCASSAQMGVNTRILLAKLNPGPGTIHYAIYHLMNLGVAMFTTLQS